MSDTLASLRRKLDGADTLKSVVRTMKAMAASSIGQYEAAVAALLDYERTVKLGLTACLRQAGPPPPVAVQPKSQQVAAIVFGSDQGLVGQFNELMADFVIQTLSQWPGEKQVWVVGERLHARLADAKLCLLGLYAVPNSVMAIAPLIGSIQIDCEARRPQGDDAQLLVMHNRPQPGGQYQPVSQRLLPLDAVWQQALADAPWPTACLPQAVNGRDEALRALIREYLFIALFQACAESLNSENASRLAAMQRAEKNIDTLADHLKRSFYQLRQNSIDEELFDVISGFNALSVARH